ncbi:hypothetical protein E1298_22455 [Actinomadura rubrisoli]|uniref:FHA domain-containing protein n=1 Tax=Actinomadura rubrisoli TaxID=2530368 RepID=A0A4R5B9D2_9ACTN|nr:hypothetical protein E1298_22455 [Actinomadura rubrisoli]
MPASLDELVAVEVSAADGVPRRLDVGERLVFGRGPGVDLPLGEDRFTSRRVGEVAVLADGVRIVNLSRKQALLVQAGPGEPVRLPALVQGSHDGGHLLRAGSALVGSARMLEQRLAVHVVVPPVAPGEIEPPPYGISTEARVRMNLETREFMVALLLCRPWLERPDRIGRLPSQPELGRLALETANAHHLLRRIDADAESRERFHRKIHDHVKTLRGKLARHGLVPAEEVVGHSAIVSALLHFDVIGPRHLALLQDEHWLSVQENKWWNCM